MKYINIFQKNLCTVINLPDTSKNVHLSVGDEVVLVETDTWGNSRHAILGRDGSDGKFYLETGGVKRYNVQGTEVL